MTSGTCISLDAHLPDDDSESLALEEAAARLYPSNPLLGLFHLNHLSKRAAEEDERTRDEDSWA